MYILRSLQLPLFYLLYSVLLASGMTLSSWSVTNPTSDIVLFTTSENKTDRNKTHLGTFLKSFCYSSVLVAARKMTLTNAECLALDFQWLVQKGYYCFVEAAAPIGPLAMDGSKSCLYSFTQQASEVRTELCVKCSSVSLLWLWCEVIICPEHAGDLLTLMWCWSSWAGWFLWVNGHKWIIIMREHCLV